MPASTTNPTRTQIRNRVLQGVFMGLILLSIVFCVWWYDFIWPWIGLVVSIALESGRMALRKAALSEKDKEKDSTYKFFFYGIRVVIIIMLIVGILGMLAIYQDADCEGCVTYQAIGMAMVMLWSVVFLSYFIWAVYFYNINFGITEEEWERIKEEKRKKNTGQFYSQEVLDEEPHYNPYEDQTFGLPPGTVRGMIAFTLLFGGLAMLIVSIGLKNEIEDGSIFWDHYEFFKTAFIMMIAFYFGTRGLELLKDKPAALGTRTAQTGGRGAAPTGSSMPVPGGGGGGSTGTAPAQSVTPFSPADPMAGAGTKVELPGKDAEVTGETFEDTDPMAPKG